MFFNEYPYRNLTDLNLDYLLKQIKYLTQQITDFVNINSIKYANPIQWNITKQYEKNTVVIDGNTGTAYLSVQAVPNGIALANTDYWTVIFTLDILASNHNITAHDAGGSLTATFPSDEGDWILWNAILYKAIRPIVLHEAYLVGYNLTATTVDDFVHEYVTALTNEIAALANILGDLTDLNTTDKTNLVNAINEVLSTIATVAGDLTDLNTTDKSNLVNAINEVLATIGTVAGDLTNLNTTDKTNLVAAVNEVVGIIGALSDLTTTDQTSIVNAINELVNAVSGISTTVGNIASDVGDLTQLDTSDKTSLVNAINEVNSSGGGAVSKINNFRVLNVVEESATGDGVTDDTAAFNSAIAKINNGDYKVLYIPAGNYLIKGLNQITTGCTIIGSGATTVLTTNEQSAGGIFNFSNWDNGLFCNLKIVDTFDNDGIIHVGTGNMIKFESIWIDGVDKFIYFGADTDTTVNAYNATLKDIYGNVKRGFMTSYGSRSCILLDNCVINSERAYNSAAISIDDKAGQDTLEVYNCLFQRFHYGITSNNVASVTTSNYFISNTIFDGIYERSIVINSFGKFYRALIRDCWFSTFDSSGSYESILVQVLGSGTVSGIYVDNCTAPYCYYNNMTFVKVSGVSVTNCNLPTYVNSSLNFNQCSRIEVNNNSIGADGTNVPATNDPPFSFSSCTDVLVVGNRITNGGYTPSGVSNYKFIANLNLTDAVG